ncbi:MAG: sugar ABC transporter ATP-binding protein [Thermanaeromonas sp.]|uniref:sugar ABC transporter ATP-binding protein n=1 Tax=Thermanaeromonas sp. TaxID=2003697 RepID=UPI00243BFCAC|nr:sugar ABC transporter ATP-binding protein [Thermanaeromonas sp.]MCG0278880.1 sugar ABC transporter ATP-binding protein [Thermanaeromonas sp.]
MREPFLKLRGICKRFPGVVALDNVDLDVYSGEIHVLLGENGAGKSTLIKILTGAYQKDAGEIIIDGKEVQIRTPREALQLGISCIYQELNLIPHLSVAENIFLGREPKLLPALGIIDLKDRYKRSAALLKELGCAVSPGVKVKDLGLGKQQMVEIAKALSLNARLVIMDEPTSSLSEKEVEELFRVVRQLKEKGIAIIFVSHKLEEIRQIADRVTVLRDGRKVATLARGEFDIEELIKLMVGRTLKEKFPKINVRRGREALRVEDIWTDTGLKGVSFSAYEGEVLGIAGLVGAGRTELARAIFGADPLRKGNIFIYGQRVDIKCPEDAIRAGLAFLTEDRKTQGLILGESVAFNITLAGIKQFRRWGFLDIRRQFETAEQLARDLKVKPLDIRRKARELSGGNQQKVVLAKWLCTRAKIFIFDEPTRGIDVGAKVEVYNLINQLLQNGAAVIMISSELPEILGMSDRILVMSEGRITGEFLREEATQEKIMKAATGGY